jgi:hypothetical protein
MKLTLLTLLCLVYTSLAHAQFDQEGLLRKRMERSARVWAGHSEGLKGKQWSSKNKTTGLKERLIGYGLFFDTTRTNLIDTSKFQYSGIRGSEFDMNYWVRIEVPDRPRGYTFNGFWDTATRWGTFHNDRTITAYDAAGRVVSDIYQVPTMGSYIDNFKSDYTYDAQGNMILVRDFYRDTAANQWVQFGSTINVYNSGGRLASDTTFKISSQYPICTEYTYDLAGNLSQKVHGKRINNIWEYDYRYTYTYYPANTLKTISKEIHSGIWYYDFIDSMGYNAANSLIYEVERVPTVGGVWQTTDSIIRVLNVNDNPDTIFYYSHSGSFPTSNVFLFGVFTYKYNSYNHPVKERIWFYSQNYWETYFYYEPHSDNLTLEEVSSAPLNLYPNPAKEVLTIHGTKGSGGKDLKVEIINLLGRVVSSGLYTGAGDISIPVGGLAPGTYVVTISSDNQVYRKAFIKQ